MNQRVYGEIKQFLVYEMSEINSRESSANTEKAMKKLTRSVEGLISRSSSSNSKLLAITIFLTASFFIGTLKSIKQFVIRQFRIKALSWKK